MNMIPLLFVSLLVFRMIWLRILSPTSSNLEAVHSWRLVLTPTQSGSSLPFCSWSNRRAQSWTMIDRWSEFRVLVVPTLNWHLGGVGEGEAWWGCSLSYWCGRGYWCSYRSCSISTVPQVASPFLFPLYPACVSPILHLGHWGPPQPECHCPVLYLWVVWNRMSNQGLKKPVGCRHWWKVSLHSRLLLLQDAQRWCNWSKRRIQKLCSWLQGGWLWCVLLLHR